jgi:hypothetical protein
MSVMRSTKKDAADDESSEEDEDELEKQVQEQEDRANNIIRAKPGQTAAFNSIKRDHK